MKLTVIVVLIVLGVLAGVLPFLIKNHYLDIMFGDTSNSKTTGWQDNGNTTDRHNGSSYELDPRLSRSFYGIDYTPIGAQLEFGCSVTQEDVVEDLKILHQMTPRLRLYGFDCDQAHLVMNGMKMLNIDMGLILTIWVDGNATTYERQYNAFWNFLNQFGADHITGVSVGNEGKKKKTIQTPTFMQISNDHFSTPAELIERIRNVKTQLKERGYEHIPVFTTDIRSLPDIMPEEDQVLDNVHPFFAGVTVDQASSWTWKYFKDVVIVPTIRLARSKGIAQVKPALISEVGWPTAPESKTYQGAVPSLQNLEKLLFSFVCQSNQKGVPYYWFEFKDAPWKNATFNEPREAFWGLFDKDRRLKVPHLPNCPLPLFKRGDVSVPQPEFAFQ
ncbi:glycoside hydrolase superfamily [Chlamydoabsidia padenii]|nr:glycoside hydrolase superfamily [Chlamydoabsidia padenii]